VLTPAVAFGLFAVLRDSVQTQPLAWALFAQAALTALAVNCSPYERILYGQQRAGALMRAVSVGALIAAALAVTATRMDDFALASLTAAALLPTIFPGLMARFILRRTGTEADVAQSTAPDVTAFTGMRGRFWTLQLCGVFAFGLDQVLVTVLARDGDAAVFAAHNRLFVMGASVVSVFSASFRPEMTRLIAEGRGRDAQRMYRRLVGAIAGLSVCIAMLQPLGVLPMSWFHRGTALDRRLSLVLAVWFVVLQVGIVLGQVQAAINDLELQVKLTLAMTVANFCLSVAFVVAMGPVGGPLGSIISYTPVALIPVLLRLRRADFWEIRADPSDRGTPQPIPVPA
jgi:O-antigen/teichoic acid export membrane protein